MKQQQHPVTRHGATGRGETHHAEVEAGGREATYSRTVLICAVTELRLVPPREFLRSTLQHKTAPSGMREGGGDVLMLNLPSTFNIIRGGYGDGDDAVDWGEGGGGLS